MTSDNKKEIPLWLVSVWVSIGILILMVVWPMISNSIKEARIKPLKQVTHERVADMEQYVYDKVGPDIYFKSPNIDYEAHTAELYLIQDERELDYYLFDEARSAINEFLEQNPDYFLNDEYSIDLYYQERDHIPHNDYVDYPISYSSNHFQFNGYCISSSEMGFDQIDLYFEGVNAVACRDNFRPKHVYGSEDVIVLNMTGQTPSYETIMEIIANLPNLKYLSISTWDSDNYEQLTAGLQEAESEVVILIRYK